MRKIHNYFILFVIIFLLLGCATRAQQQYELMERAANDAKAKAQVCYDKSNLNKSVKYVHENIVIDEDSSLNKYQLLSSTQKINEEMTAHLISYLDETNKCRNVAIEGWSKVHPSFVTVYANAFRNYDILYGRLLSGEINIGEFNRLLQEARSVGQKEWDIAGNNLNSALENEHNNELANRQRAAAALQTFSIQQQQNQILYNSLNRARTTNCNMIGKYVNCTSY